jgi:Tfp pilus assembly ATPase PilU
VAAHEIMIATSAIKNLIRENKIAQMYSSIQTGQSLGMQTLDQNLADLVRRNVISPAEARARPRSRRTSRVRPDAKLLPRPGACREGASKGAPDTWNATRPRNSSTTCCA